MEEDDYTSMKIILWLILFLVFGIIIIACKHPTEETIMTVNGSVQTSEIGRSLTHEHILVDFIGADSTGYFRYNRDSVIEKALPYLYKAKEAGVNTIFECTPEFLGRDPVVLKDLSKITGLIFVTNTGYYGAYKTHLPASFYKTDAESLAEKWISEYNNGIDQTGIKPGFIKISVDQDDTLSSDNRKIINAAALTHLKTGLVIASHTGPEKPAFAQIDILKKNGVDPSSFIWVHAQSGTLESNIEAARMGAWISLDNVRQRSGSEPDAPFSINWYADRIFELKKQGLLNKVLISHDSGWYDPAKPGGGPFNGFTDIFEFLLPVLKEKGLTDEDIDQITVKNPAEAFTIKIRKLNSP